jgi:enhancing lycopene biosynthesis protein 2
LGRQGIPARLTIGNDPSTAAAIGKMGAIHCDCPVSECIVDEENKIVTTPAYMLANGPAEVFEGARKLVESILRLTER